MCIEQEKFCVHKTVGAGCPCVRYPEKSRGAPIFLLSVSVGDYILLDCNFNWPGGKGQIIQNGQRKVALIPFCPCPCDILSSVSMYIA